MTKQGLPSDSSHRHSTSLKDEQTWMDKKNAACKFRDERLKKRFLLLQQFWNVMGADDTVCLSRPSGSKAAIQRFR
jgi:hypothetical protein